MLASTLVFTQISASAETSGDFEYELLDDGTAKITRYIGSATTLDIPSTLDGYTVTSIGSSAFEDYTSLTSITIPNSVTSIGYSAFEDCTSLTSITIPNSVTSIGNWAFYGCTSLTSVTIPDGVTSIAQLAFENCTSLTSVTIPKSVISIDISAFEGCTSLTSITIPDSVTSIGKSAFDDCTSLNKVNITSIKSWCNINFSGYNSNPLCYAKNLYLDNQLVTNLVIPNSVTSIGNWAFYGCTSLTSITIPDSVTTIGEDAFLGCSSLTSVTIPNSVTSIGKSAFEDCKSLTSITIPDSVTSIGGSAFDKTTTLITSCNNEYVINYIKSNYYKLFLNHNYAFTSEKPATCYENGVKNYICTYCKATHSETIMAGHDFQWVVVKKATCTEEGEKEYKCTRCNYVKKTESIKKNPHVSSGKWITVETKNCFTKGKKVIRCKNCEKTLSTKYLKKLKFKYKPSIKKITIEKKRARSGFVWIVVKNHTEYWEEDKYKVTLKCSIKKPKYTDRVNYVLYRKYGSKWVEEDFSGKRGNITTYEIEKNKTVQYKIKATIYDGEGHKINSKFSKVYKVKIK